MIKINKDNIEQLIRGASLLTTGGGFPYAYQVENLATTINDYPNFSVSVLNANNFNLDDYVATIAEIGPADAPEVPKQAIAIPMVQAFEKMTGKKIVALCPLELGVEIVTLHMAYFANLPLLDCDLTGSRAVPLIGIDVLTALNKPFAITPCVFGTDYNEIITLETAVSIERAEDIMRNLSLLSNSGGVVAIFGLIKIRDLVEAGLINNAYSRAIKLSEAKNIQAFKDNLVIKKSWDVEIISKKLLEKKGFNALVFEMQDKQITKNIYKIVVLNEVLFVLDNLGNMLAEIPDQILPIDINTMQGIHTKDFYIGRNLKLLVIEPEKPWQTLKGREIYGQERFRFLLDLI